MHRFFLLLWLISSTLWGQDTWEGGMSYGNSDIFRSDKPSYYNYSNQEYGIFIQRNMPFNKASEKKWKKYWNIESNFVLSDFEYLYNKTTSTEFRLNTLIGISLKFPVEKLDLRLNAKFGPGYHSGYEQRMHEGIYFTEALSLQAGLSKPKKWNPLMRIGVMHISNANIYELNKGLEVFYIKIGWRLPSTPSH